MIEDMTVRGFGEKTQSDYIRHVRNFTLFLGRSPDHAQPEDLRLFQVHQREQGVRADRHVVPVGSSAMACCRAQPRRFIRVFTRLTSPPLSREPS
jgi:hypothetical protein